MTTMEFLLDATNQTYNSEALGYVAGLKNGIIDAAQILGISAGAIAGAMAEERMDYGVKQQAVDHYAEYGLPLTALDIITDSGSSLGKLVFLGKKCRKVIFQDLTLLM